MPTPIFPLSTATWRNPNEGKNKTRSGTQAFGGEREEVGGEEKAWSVMGVLNINTVSHIVKLTVHLSS